MIDIIRPIRRALISVSDKRGIVEFSRFLVAQGVQIFSTGGTAKLLTEQGLIVTEVADYTGFPEIMNGRIKTLHPKVHGGLLGRERIDQEVMQEHGIEAIDLLVVNLYPFVETVMQAGDDHNRCIEQIDIGGPAMIRSAAKNYNRVTVVVDPDDYIEVERGMKESGGISFTLRSTFATKAFQQTANYDKAIAAWLSHSQEVDADQDKTDLPEQLNLSVKQSFVLRYGENPHQRAAFYQGNMKDEGLAGIVQIQGKPLSFNNIIDAETASHCVNEFTDATCVIVKHANPCGVACGENISEAYHRAVAADATSAFGGIVAINRELNLEMAQRLVDGAFVEVVVAPEISPAAASILRAKPSIRVLQGHFLTDALECRSIAGGLLAQDKDTAKITRHDLQVQTSQLPDDDQISGLLFAWRIVKYLKSNAIVLATGSGLHSCSAGIGAGQTSRVESVRIAVTKAGVQQTDTTLVMASDAFFPFPDSVEIAAQAGVKAIIQPGGSIRDEDVISAAERRAIAMVFTGIRHFRH